MRTAQALSIWGFACALMGAAALWLAGHPGSPIAAIPLNVWLRANAAIVSLAVLLLNLAAMLALVLWVTAVGGACRGRRWDWLVALVVAPPAAAALYPWFSPEAITMRQRLTPPTATF